VFVLLALSFVALPARAQSDAQSGGGPPAATEKKSPYELHMDNGWKLYHEQNYVAAAAEFKAAYDAEPKASPLINLALSYKKLFAYPKAIDALERALAKHADSMKPEHKEAAEREIQELRELLAWVNVKVVPADAKLTIDGEPVESKRGDPVAMAPGSHRFRAEAEGYKPAEAVRTLTSGQGNAAVELKLELVTGKLHVSAQHARALIEIDGEHKSMGAWTGLLPPGVHTVRVLHEDDAQVMSVFVRAGGRHQVTQNEDGTLVSDSPAPNQKPKDKPVEPEVRRGLYGTAAGSLLTVFHPVRDFTRDSKGRDAWGAAVGLHIGYRVAEWAGFELFGQVSDIRVLGKVEAGAVPVSAKIALQSVRPGGLFRVMYPPRTMFRAIGTLGAGVLIERVKWTSEDGATLPSQYPLEWEGGVGAFGEIDIGVEMEISNVLIDVVTQNIIQSTKHLEVEGGNIFDEKPSLVFGISLRVGYGIW
jgi:hypothetical protein